MSHAKRKQTQRNDDYHKLAEQPAVKRIKTYTDADAELAKILENLGVEQEEIRLKAAADAVELFSRNPDSTEKLLNRLIRGLCSSRKASRPGFFVALTEILKVAADRPQLLAKNSPNQVVEGLLEQVDASTRPGSAPTPQEKKEYLIGRLAACSAIVHSSIVFQDGVDDKHLKAFLQAVWAIRDQDAQLAEQCGKFYVDIVTVAGGINRLTKPIEVTLKFLVDKSAIKTAEGLAVWIEASRLGLDVNFPKHIWHHKNPFSSKEISTIKKLLSSLETKDISNGQSTVSIAATGRRRDAPHFVWHILLKRLFDDDLSATEEEPSRSTLSLFGQIWSNCVDEFYFASSSSPERKAVGFRIFSFVLAEGPIWACNIALSPNLVNCLLNQSSKAERYLHQSAKSILKVLKSRATMSTDFASTLCLNLIFIREAPEPERIKRAKSVIVEVFQAADIMVAGSIVDSYILAIQRSLFSSISDEKHRQKYEASTKLLADQLLIFCRSRKADLTTVSTDDVSWGLKLITGLARSICLKDTSVEADSKEMQTPHTSVHDMLESRLWSCLREMLSDPNEQKGRMLEHVCNDLAAYKQEHLSALADNSEAWQIMCESREVVHRIQMDKEDETPGNMRSSVAAALRLMLTFAQLQVYCGEPDSVEILRDLCDYVQNISEDDGNKSLDSLVDILLSFCSKPVSTYRNIVEQAFTALSLEVSFSDLQPLLRILKQDENATGQKELFDQQMNEDIDASEQQTFSSEDFDHRNPDKLSANSESSGSESGNDESDFEEYSDHEEADEALNNSLAEILQTRQFNPNLAAGEQGEDEESSDESMDDEQMEALGMDEKLSKIFSERRPQQVKPGKMSDKKREQKEAKQNIVSFKSRVLDLLSIYAKQRHSSADTLGILLPLLNLIEATRSSQISKKAAEVIDTYCKVAKGKGMALSAAANEIWDMLGQVHEQALKFASRLHAQASSKSSLFLARLLMLQQHEGAMDRLIKLYAETHSRRFQAGSKLPASFWTDFVNWTVSINDSKN